MRLYNKAHYYIKQINCDGEFNPVLTPFESQLETSINRCMPDEHVPDAERNNRVIQERVRIKYHRMPYKKILELWFEVRLWGQQDILIFFLQKEVFQDIFHLFK